MFLLSTKIIKKILKKFAEEKDVNMQSLVKQRLKNQSNFMMKQMIIIL